MRLLATLCVLTLFCWLFLSFLISNTLNECEKKMINNDTCAITEGNYLDLRGVSLCRAEKAIIDRAGLTNSTGIPWWISRFSSERVLLKLSSKPPRMTIWTVSGRSGVTISFLCISAFNFNDSRESQIESLSKRCFWATDGHRKWTFRMPGY